MTTAPQIEVDLPAGGQLQVNSPEEKDMWDESAGKYVADYGINKQNDKVLLGAILTQGLIMYRAQQQLTDPQKASDAQKRIIAAADQIRELEKALGIDKKTREAGGQHTVANYLETVKRAAHEKGVRISDRVLEYEKVMMEARWKLRLLRNGDAEDRAVHGIDETAIVNWLEEELGRLEEVDKKWAHTKGAVFIGKV